MFNRIKRIAYKYKRVFAEILKIRIFFSNWDEIIKRSLKGKFVSLLKCRNDLNISCIDGNGLSIFHEIFIDQIYTPDFLKIEKNDVVFDIGANIGVFSLFAAKCSASKIYAFEPHPQNFQFLVENIRQNNLINIDPYQVGLAATDGNQVLVEANIPGGHRLASMTTINPIHSSLSIQTMNINTFIQDKGITHIDFMKLDCEGAEGEILMSLGVDGLANISKLAIEFHDNASSIRHEDILELLHRAGFQTILKWDGMSPYGYVYAKKI